MTKHARQLLKIFLEDYLAKQNGNKPNNDFSLDDLYNYLCDHPPVEI